MFEKNNNKYINISEIKKVIYEVLKFNSFEETREYINNLEVKVTEDDIKKFLEHRFIIEKPDLKRSIVNRKVTKGIKSSEQFMKELKENLDATRYGFDPYTLKYYKKYIKNLKIKLNKFFDIIDQNVDKDTLEKYDITISEDKILTRDAERMIKPILYCLSDLLKTNNEANNLETYLTNKINLNYIYRNELNIDDVYPSPEIQLNDEIGNQGKKFLPHTKKQKEMCNERFVECMKLLINLVDSNESNNKQKVLF